MQILKSHNQRALIGVGVFTFFVLTIQVSHATILFRSTWEDVDSPVSWTINQGGSGRVQAEWETLKKNGKQAHGWNSLHIYDPDNTSYATAISPIFTNTADEYLIDFYIFNIWKPGFASHFNNYPVCFPMGNNGSSRTDIGVYIYEEWHSPNIWMPVIYIEDLNGMHRVEALLDSGEYWYRCQIHRKPDNTVDFYFKGNNLGNFQPLNPSFKTTAIRVGADAAHASAYGEAYLDDYIVTTVPNGNHPRLFYSESDRGWLDSRTRDITPQPFGYSFARVYSDLVDSANTWVNEMIWYQGQYYRGFYATNGYYPMLYPYQQPDASWSWPMIFNTDMHRRLEEVGFAYWLGQAQNHRTYCHEVLHSISNWERWHNPSDTGTYPPVCLDEPVFTVGYHLIVMMARLYDDAFGALSNYEKMSVQNSLITLGLQEAYLQMMTYPKPGWGNPGGNIGANITGSCGVGGLVLDDPTLQAQYVNGAIIKCDSLFNNQYYRPPQPNQPGPVIADTMGAMNYQCIGYDFYGFMPTLLFAFALKNVLGNNHFLTAYDNMSNHGAWIIYSMQGWYQLPFAPSYGDVYSHYRENYRYIPLLAAYYQKPELQWLFSRIFQERQDENNYCINRDSYLISPFVTYDPNLPSQPPTNFSVGRRFHDAWVAFQGGWGDSSATLLIKTGPNWGHAHFDCNSIEYSFGPSYFIDEWLGYMGTQNPYDHTSYCHNTIMVDQVTPNDPYGLYGQKGWVSCLDAPSNVVENFYSDQYYGYSCSEAGSLYNPISLKTFKRKLFFTLDGHFVLKDEVKSNPGEHHQYFALNWDYRQGSISGDNNSLTVIANEQKRRCMVNVLLPENRQINYASSDFIHIQTPSGTQTTDSTQYLLVYYPYHENELLPTAALFQTDIPSVGDPMIGTRFSGGSGQRVDDEIFLFNRNQGAVVLNTVYRLTPRIGSGIAVNYVADLLPNATYQVINYNTVTGDKTVATVASSDGGSVKYDAPVLGQEREITLRYQILINGGAKFTNNRSVTVQPSFNTFAVQMMVRNAGEPWGSWQPFSISFPWLLPEGDGQKDVEIKFRDAAGNESGVGLGSIILDTNVPIANISSPYEFQVVSGIVPFEGNANEWPEHHLSLWEIYHNANAWCSGTSEVGMWWPMWMPGWFGDWNSTWWPNGYHQHTLVVQDSANNQSQYSVTVYVNNSGGGDGDFAAGFGSFGNVPVNVATDLSGNLYVAEALGSRLRKLSPKKDSLFAFSARRGNDSTGLSWPAAMVLKDSTFLWVADGLNHCIKKFDRQGVLLLRFGSFGSDTSKFKQPCGIALDKKGRLWVIDRLNHRVQVFDSTGKFLFKFGTQGADPGKFNSPTGVAVTRSGHAWISDTRNNRLQVFDSLGHFVKAIQQVDSLGLDTPLGICSDTLGNIFVVDSRHNRIVELNPRGKRLLTFGSSGDSLGQFRAPVGVASSPGGHYLYVADVGTKRVQRFWVIRGDSTGGGPQGRGSLPRLPTVYSLDQSHPNPTTGQVKITYALPKESLVRLTVYNVAGQVVWAFTPGKQKAGYYSCNWDGRGTQGHRVGAGVYFYRMDAGNWSKTRKMTVIR